MSTTADRSAPQSGAASTGGPAGGPALLRVAGLEVHLPTGARSEVDAVKGVDLTVRRGERVGIVGESGSGKTVTGRAVAGLLPASPRVRVRGSIRFADREMVGASAKAWAEIRSRTVGMIFQDPLTFLNPTMKVGAQVAESVAPQRRRPDRAARQQAVGFLALAGLDNAEDVARRFPHELSGGMRQRVLIAIAIAKQPDLLVADEPTTALDATVQQRVLDTLGSAVRELGTSLVLISHDIAVIAGMTDRIYVMYRGRVVESGATETVLQHPEHPYTRALLHSVRSLSDEGVDLYTIPPSLQEWQESEEATHAS